MDSKSEGPPLGDRSQFIIFSGQGISLNSPPTLQLHYQSTQRGGFPDRQVLGHLEFQRTKLVAKSPLEIS